MDLLLESTRRVEARHFWFRGLRRFLRPLLARATADRPAARILDCGSGTGANLALLSKFGAVSAVELNPYGAGLARRAGFARVARATVACLPFRDGTFDVVTSLDVLYCLTDEDERGAIDEMYRVLRPGGAAIVNVAAMRVLRGNHSVLAEEVRRYDRAGLRAALERAGFRVERLTHTNASLFPLVFAQRMIERAAGLPPDAGAARQMKVPPAPLNELLTGVLAAESLVVRAVSLPFGSSLLCLARKPVHSA